MKIINTECLNKKNIIVVIAALCLMGCSTKYDTVDGKDISVRVRSIWADVDYDSRRCEPLPPLEPLE